MELIKLTMERNGSMFTYEYECKKCGHAFSLAMSVDEHQKKKVSCPKCNSDEVKHVMQSVLVTTSKKS